MRTEVWFDEDGNPTINISDEILEELGWELGTPINVQIAMTGPYLIVEKVEKKK